MPTLCNLESCTSCMSCYNACPFNAIEIVENEIGARVPSVNADRCRDCGLCEKSCPILNKPTLREPQSAFALYSKEETDRKTCASGGAATVLSRHVLRQGGFVYGATAHGGCPRFVKVSEEKDLDLLKGSKYVYCDPEKIYQQIKSDLQTGRPCLFIGTPCNAAALRTFLRKDYDNLYLVDLVCHGTPPFKYLSQHLASKNVSLPDVANITFRGKFDFFLTAYNAEGSIIYQQNQYEDAYFAAFLRGAMFRPSCYQCPFARRERASDITIGDFWGIAAGAINGYKGKISLALINTARGQRLFEASKDAFVCEQRTVDEAVAGNDQLRKPSAWSETACVFHETFKASQSVQAAFSRSGIRRQTLKMKVRRYVLYIPKMIRNLIK